MNICYFVFCSPTKNQYQDQGFILFQHVFLIYCHHFSHQLWFLFYCRFFFSSSAIPVLSTNYISILWRGWKICLSCWVPRAYAELQRQRKKKEKWIGMDETISYYFQALCFAVKKPQCASHVHEETAFDLEKRWFQPLCKGLGEVNA